MQDALVGCCFYPECTIVAFARSQTAECSLDMVVFLGAEVVIFETKFSVTSQVGVPDGDRFEPPGEGAGGPDVTSERRTEGTKDSH